MKWWLIAIVVIILIISLFLYFSWYPTSQVFGNVVYRLDSNKVLLTFDDGPGPYTLQILDILKEKNITAVFFLIGTKAQENPDIVNRIVAEGHVVGVHSMTHSHLWKNNYNEIFKTKELLENMTGNDITFFRPPYGFRTWDTLNVAKQANLITFTWDVFPMDYKRTSSLVVKNVLKNTKNGSVICMHDGVTNSFETVDALPKIIDGLKEKGFKFINANELKFN